MNKKDQTKAVVVVGLLLIGLVYYITKKNQEGYARRPRMSRRCGTDRQTGRRVCCRSGYRYLPHRRRCYMERWYRKLRKKRRDRLRTGCMDPEARNYNPNATISGPCTPKECRCLTTATTAEEYSRREGVMERYKSIAGIQRYLEGVLRRIARPNTEDNYRSGCPMRSNAGTTYNCSDKTTKESCEAGPYWNRPIGNNNSYRHCEWK